MKKPERELPFDEITTYVLESKRYLQTKYCIGLFFKNEDIAGQTIAIVNGKQLQPPPAPPATGSGEYYGFCGNEYEFYRGRVQIRFTDLAGTQSATGRLSVSERYYMVEDN